LLAYTNDDIPLGADVECPVWLEQIYDDIGISAVSDRPS